MEIIYRRVLRYLWQVLNDNVENAESNHCVEDLRIKAGRLKGNFYHMAFQNSDLGKWLKAVVYALRLLRIDRQDGWFRL